MVRIGLVGIGFMGMIHFLAAKKVKNAAISAICSRSSRKLTGNWKDIRGNFGPDGIEVDLDGIKKYSNYDDLLNDPDVDLIDICAPSQEHCDMCLRAMRAGKNVLVEKPIALKLSDAEKMIKEAKRLGRLLMVAHVLPFFPEFDFVYRVNKEERFGKLLGGQLNRIISKPDWSANVEDNLLTGGPGVDLHIHDAHFVNLIAGIPEKVSSSGVLDGQGVVKYLNTNYYYGKNGPGISCSSGAIAMEGRPFVHGFDLYFEKATIAYSSSGISLTVFTDDGKRINPNEGDSFDPVDAFTKEIQSAVDGICNGQEAECLKGKSGYDALLLCQKEIESVIKEKMIKVE